MKVVLGLGASIAVAAAVLGAQLDPNYELNRALIRAASAGDAEDVRRLVERGARLDASDHAGATALSRAAEKGHLDIVRLLLDLGADPRRIGRPGPVSGTLRGALPPLSAAAESAHLEIVTLLLEKQRPSVDELSAALCHGAKSEPITALLMDAGADPNIRDVALNSPVTYAIHARCTPCVRLMLPKTNSEERSWIVEVVRGTTEVDPEIRRLVEEVAVRPSEERTDDLMITLFRTGIESWHRKEGVRFTLKMNGRSAPRKYQRMLREYPIARWTRGQVVISIDSVRWVTLNEAHAVLGTHCGPDCGNRRSVHVKKSGSEWTVVRETYFVR